MSLHANWDAEAIALDAANHELARATANATWPYYALRYAEDELGRVLNENDEFGYLEERIHRIEVKVERGAD